jgi:16S rRNA processing protein RimM
MPDYFEIGVITGAHGIKGDARVLPWTFDAKRFCLLKTVDIKAYNDIIHLTIENVRFHKQFVIVKFRGVDSVDGALRLKGGVIVIPGELGLPLGEDEYYTADLYGMTVVTDEGEALGIISDIISTGANDVYVVAKPGVKDLLIPAIKQCILDVDVAGRKMTVRLMEGLR